MDKNPYPDRVLPRANLGAAERAALKERTLTNLYNRRPAWLTDAHAALDARVATACGWTDYFAACTDNEILERLMALNLERAASKKTISFLAERRITRKHKPISAQVALCQFIGLSPYTMGLSAKSCI